MKGGVFITFRYFLSLNTNLFALFDIDTKDKSVYGVTIENIPDDFLERNVTSFYIDTDAIDNSEFIETTITIAVELD